MTDGTEEFEQTQRQARRQVVTSTVVLLNELAGKLQIHHGPMHVAEGACVALACYADFASTTGVPVDRSTVETSLVARVVSDKGWQGAQERSLPKGHTFPLPDLGDVDLVNPVIDRLNELGSSLSLSPGLTLELATAAIGRYVSFASWHCAGCVSATPELPYAFASHCVETAGAQYERLRAQAANAV